MKACADPESQKGAGILLKYGKWTMYGAKKCTCIENLTLCIVLWKNFKIVSRVSKFDVGICE